MRQLFLLTSLLLIFFSYAHASVGCMDNSKHTHIKDGFDYKTLHYVSCSCPCNKMRHLARKNKCFKCRHYIKPDTLDIDMNFLKAETGKSLFPAPLTDRFM